MSPLHTLHLRPHFPHFSHRFPKAHFSTNQLFYLPLKMDPKAHFSPLCHDITEGKRQGEAPNSDFITNPLLTSGSWCQQQEFSQRNPSHCVPSLNSGPEGEVSHTCFRTQSNHSTPTPPLLSWFPGETPDTGCYFQSACCFHGWCSTHHKRSRGGNWGTEIFWKKWLDAYSVCVPGHHGYPGKSAQVQDLGRKKGINACWKITDYLLLSELNA